MSLKGNSLVDESCKVMRSPRAVHVNITSRCNLHCKYCYYFGNESVNYNDLPTSEWLKFFKELGNLSVMNVIIAGGEPFIRNDLNELIDGIVNNRMRYSILSNGSLIDDKTAEYITRTRRCDSVQISVDGSTPEVHDICRGTGSFNSAIEGIRTLQRHKVPVTARVTIHRYNIYDLDNVAKLLLEELGLKSFSTNAASYIGSCRTNADNILLTTTDRQEAMKTLLKLSKKYKGRITALAGPLADARIWQNMEDARLKELPSFSHGGRLTGCGCPFNEITILSDGSIVPCNMLAHLKIGHMNKDAIQEVWLGSPILNNMRLRQNIQLSSFQYCENCEYTPYCTGNCPGIGFNLTGYVDHPSPDACLRNFLADGGRIP